MLAFILAIVQLPKTVPVPALASRAINPNSTRLQQHGNYALRLARWYLWQKSGREIERYVQGCQTGSSIHCLSSSFLLCLATQTFLITGLVSRGPDRAYPRKNKVTIIYRTRVTRYAGRYQPSLNFELSKLTHKHEAHLGGSCFMQ